MVIGDNCLIFPLVSILDGTRMGNGNKIHQGTVIGAIPQDFEFCGEASECILGNDNVIRENVVINRATHTGDRPSSATATSSWRVCTFPTTRSVADKCVFGYGTKIAGDCEIGNHAIFSSGVIENANTRVGECALLQAGATFSKDIPPYVIIGGSPLKYCGINSILGKILGTDDKVLKHIANAYRLVFHGQTSVFDASLQIKQQVPDGPQIRNIVDFLTSTKRRHRNKDILIEYCIETDDSTARHFSLSSAEGTAGTVVLSVLFFPYPKQRISTS